MQNSRTIRLFTGTYVDDELFQFVYDDVKDDFSGITFGKWVEAENLHFTYHFIGDVEITRLDDVKNALSSITKEYDSVLELRGISAFPTSRRPRILHIPVYDDGLLNDIYANIATALNSLSIKTEKRKFKPHLTLQRIKDFESHCFPDAVERYKDYDFGIMNSFKVSLIQSTLTSRGPVYKIIQ